MNAINILMLGGAKRVSIGQMFIDAGKKIGYNVQLFSYELSPNVPIASIAKVIIGKKWRDADVETDIINVCKEHCINILLPFVDGAIEVAARVSQVSGVFAPVSSPEVAATMFDKVIAEKAFREAGLSVPLSVDVRYPIIAKPRTGSASKGIVIINSQKDLDSIENPSNYLFQEYIAEREEYTVDCYADSLGRALAVVPRIRIEVVGGEVSRTATVDSPEIIEISRRAIDALNLRGAVTLQFLKDKTDDRLMLMEINPRLGGGVVCSVHAGADIPSLIIREYLQLPLEPMTYRPNVEIVRYFAEVVFTHSTTDNPR